MKDKQGRPSGMEGQRNLSIGHLVRRRHRERSSRSNKPVAESLSSCLVQPHSSPVKKQIVQFHVPRLRLSVRASRKNFSEAEEVDAGQWFQSVTSSRTYTFSCAASVATQHNTGVNPAAVQQQQHLKVVLVKFLVLF